MAEVLSAIVIPFLFSEIKSKDIGIVGGKGANLGVMYNLKLPVPPGFVVTAQAYKFFLDYIF